MIQLLNLDIGNKLMLMVILVSLMFLTLLAKKSKHLNFIFKISLSYVVCCRFSAIRDVWIKAGQGFIFVYSTTDRYSFDSLQEQYDSVQKIKGHGTPIVVAGNKCDLPELRTVSTQEGVNLAEAWNVPFFETSGIFFFYRLIFLFVHPQNLIKSSAVSNLLFVE